MNKKLSLIIGVQAILIVALFWVLIFYSKDEYEAYRNSHEEDISSPNRVSAKNGINIVSLPLATQQNSGITTAKMLASTFQGKIKSIGNVIAIDSLIEAKAKYLNTKSEISLAQATIGNNKQQYQRLKTLNADDKNVSDHAVQDALVAVNADNAKITASELQLKNLQASLQLQWGEELAKLATSDQLAPHLANLLDRKNVLILVSLPADAATPKHGSTTNISPTNETSTPIKAVYVSPAAQSDVSGYGSYGKTFYYSAPAESLRIGMRVYVEADSSGNKGNSGFVIPNQALVWYGGKPWVYFKQGKNKQGDDQFARKPISTDNEVEGGWFNQGMDANSEIVVSGAQLLLSEEFKYLIKNENED
jgi:hypothetical protein